MKFSDKLFLWTTATLTVIFMAFGAFILSTFFQRILNREMEKGNTESQMFQYVFEMAYLAIPEEYGGTYSVDRVTESVMKSLVKEDNTYFVFDKDSQLLFSDQLRNNDLIMPELTGIINYLDKEKTYGCKIMESGDRYYLLNVCRSDCDGTIFYLGIQKDITSIYSERLILLNQYRMVLGILLFLGAGIIFMLSRYITRPIRELTITTRKIAAGDYKLRVHNNSRDEIGELSKSFNRMTDRLFQRMQEKELEAKQKEDFTASFAHELKTPLTSIIGYADMLSTMQLSEAERSEAAYYIFTQGKRLERLSHKLLELVSINNQEFKKIVISTKKIESTLRVTMRPIWEQRQIKGKIDMDKGNLSGDMDLLLSLLFNLLDNAVKAVEPGDFILLKGLRLENGYEIKVVDNGRGIPPEEISRITEAFYMVDKSRTRKEGGAGIGMALCKKIVELHEGSMQIGSRLGEGTVIKIFLPKEDSHAKK